MLLLNVIKIEAIKSTLLAQKGMECNKTQT